MKDYAFFSLRLDRGEHLALLCTQVWHKHPSPRPLFLGVGFGILILPIYIQNKESTARAKEIHTLTAKVREAIILRNKSFFMRQGTSDDKRKKNTGSMFRKGRWSLERARAQVEEWKELKKSLYCFLSCRGWRSWGVGKEDREAPGKSLRTQTWKILYESISEKGDPRKKSSSVSR